MTISKYLSFLLLFIFSSSFVSDGATSNGNEINTWKLIKQAKDIKVYTRRPIKSLFDEVKVETSVDNATLHQIVAILEDLKTQPKWVYATKNISLLEFQGVGQFQYHYFMEMPFPVKDRDVIIGYERLQNRQTKVVTINSKAIRNQDLLSEEFVRIKNFHSRYILTPQKNNTVKIEYYLKADPGSNLPAWVINLFTTSGPFKSMASLIDLIKSGSHSEVEVKNLIN